MDTGLIGRELAGLAPDAIDAKAIGFGVMHMLWHAHDDIEHAAPQRCARALLAVERAGRLSAGRPAPPAADGARRRRADQARCALERGRASRVGGRRWRPPPWERRTIRVVGEGNPLYVLHDMRQTELAWPTFEAGQGGEEGDGSSIRAPIVGRVAKVFVKPGDTVAKGDRIAVVEAMKMEHVLHAARDGAHRQARRHGRPAGHPRRAHRRAGGVISRTTATASIRDATHHAGTARSLDWMRLTPAFSMFFQAAASEPCVSMPRQASSMT